MSDKNPASLTSSLLARKGDAAPSDGGAAAPDMSPEVSVPIEGPSIDPDPLPDDFLSRGPDAIVPEPDPMQPSWQNAADQDAKEQPSRRRALLLALAVLLVMVLAGSAWFAANIFLDGGGLADVTSAAATRPAGKGPMAASGGLRNTSGAALAPSRPAPQGTATAQPTNPTATRALATPAPVDPVTTDPQDAPRIASPSSGAMPTAGSTAKAPAVAPPLPPPAPPVATVAPTPKAAAPVKAASTPATIQPPVKPTKPAATPTARPKPAVKVASRPTGTFALQLSSVKRAAIARKEVSRLTRRLAGVLNGMPLRIRKADLGRRGTVYRIQTAAVLTSKQAKRMCGRMKSRKQPCFLIAK